MADSFFKKIGWFLLLLLLQVLIFNHIHILRYATPMVIVYFTLLFPSSTKRGSILIWSFALGLIADTFSNTPGVAAFSLTFVAMIQPTLLVLHSNRDEENEVLIPSMRAMGKSAYIRYLCSGVFIYESLFFLLETFSFFNWKDLLINIGSSTILSILFLIAFESIRESGQHRVS